MNDEKQPSNPPERHVPPSPGKKSWEPDIRKSPKTPPRVEPPKPWPRKP